MNRTAKFVHETLRWKNGKRRNKNFAKNSDVYVVDELKRGSFAGPDDDTEFGDAREPNFMIALLRDAVDGCSHDSSASTPTKLNGHHRNHPNAPFVVVPPESQVCSIKQSPYRLLKAAESGKLDSFVKLYRQNSSRIKFTDKLGKSAIHYATAKNNVDIVRFILEHENMLNDQDNNGDTPLHHAVMNNAVDCLNVLIEFGANASILNNDMNGPVHVAVILNRVDIINELAKHKDKVNVMLRGKHGRSALHFAAIYDHDECARILLSQFDCCPKTPCNNGSYAIHEAAKNASARTLEAILEWGEKKLGIKRESMIKFYDAEGNVPLHSAVHSGDIKAVALCLKSGAVLSTQQYDLSTPVHLACSQGAIDIVKLMFTAQPAEKQACLAICDAQEFTPLHCAASFDHHELVRYLIKEGAKMTATDKEGRSPLLLAGARAAWKSAVALIELGSNVSLRDKFNRNIFHHIVMSGGNLDQFTEIISNKMQEPVDNLFNDRDLLGCTPLHYASRDGQFKSIQSLLQMGAVINLKNNENQSPLHFAARYGRLNTVKHLLESRKGHLIINEMDGEGMTPLHIASQNGHTKIVQFLLIKGALLHRDHKGRTPLHWAAINGHVETIQQILLVHSHLLDQTDKDGNSALTLAAINNRPSVASILLSLDCRIVTNNEAMTPIDYAIINKNSEVAMVMVMHQKRGEEIMKLNIKKYNSLLEGLIANMPDVVKNLLDKGIERSAENEDSPNYSIKYNFRYLRNEQNNQPSLTPSTSSAQQSSTVLPMSGASAASGASTANGDEDGNDQPLKILNLMIAYGREDLLSHSLCVKYLESKWNSYGMYFHIINMSFYSLFLVLITMNGLKLIDVTHAAHRVENSTSAHHNSIKELINENAESQEEANSVYWISVMILHLVVLNILKEFYQIYHQRFRYFSEFINFFEWMLYVSSGIMSATFLFCDIHSSYLYISTAVSVFITWFNLLFYLQRFNRGGIYVVMFLEILSTLIKVIFLFSVLIIAFGLSFYILSANFDILRFGKGFSRPLLSMIRVGTMMLGDVDFIGTFLQPILAKNLTEHSPKIERIQLFTSLFFLVIFIILMPILLMNLLIGLAVGDIETVRKDAQLKRLTMQVDLHTDLERKLPRKFIQLTDKIEIYEFPNQCDSSNLISKFYAKYILSRTQHKTWSCPTTRLTNLAQQQYEFVNFRANIAYQMGQQRKKLRDLAKHSELQLELLRLIIQKMEIQTENDFGSDDGEEDF